MNGQMEVNNHSEANGNTRSTVTPVSKVYFIIQRRGKDEKYLSGHRILKADKSTRGETKSANWTVTRSNAQRFISPASAAFQVIELFGPTGFNHLRLVTIKERS